MPSTCWIKIKYDQEWNTESHIIRVCPTGGAHMTKHFILHAAHTMVYFKQFTHNGSLRLGSTGNAVHGKGLSYDLGSSFLLNLTANWDTMKPEIIGQILSVHSFIQHVWWKAFYKS